MIKTKLLHVSSRDKSDPKSSTSDFIVHLNSSDGLQAVKKVVLKHATIPNSVYNIHEYNNRFVWQQSDLSYHSAIISPGNYTISKLLINLNAVLSGAGISVVMHNAAFPELTPTLRFITSTAVIFLNINQGNPMADVLGITDGSDGVAVTTHFGRGLFDLSGPSIVLVQSRTLGESNFVSSRNKVDNVVGVVQNDVAFGSYIHYDSNHSELDSIDVKRHGKNISTIDIRITSDGGTILNLNGLHVDLIFKIYY
jgi:hypothetical protein